MNQTMVNTWIETGSAVEGESYSRPSNTKEAISRLQIDTVTVFVKSIADCDRLLAAVQKMREERLRLEAERMVDEVLDGIRSDVAEICAPPMPDNVIRMNPTEPVKIMHDTFGESVGPKDDAS